MKNSGKYMAQRQALFGLEIAYAGTIKQVLKKAKINPKYDAPGQYGLYVAKNGIIVRIHGNGKEY